MPGAKDKNKRTKLLAVKNRKPGKDYKDDESNIKGKLDESYGNRLLKNKKQRDAHELHPVADGSDEQMEVANDALENAKRKSNRKRRKHEKKAKVDNFGDEAGDNSDQQNAKSKKPRKKKKNHMLSKNEENLLSRSVSEEDDVYQISSGDEDFSKGMRKWIMEYQQARPGLNVLQERIDDFITAHEEREEQERKEREAQAAGDGWTVVVHHKGRKKTTDVETGIAVGSVAQAAVMDKMAKKKNKDVGLDFYRFQRREAKRNELMMLQSKFEQDKKRIQQMRAARKFRPY